MIITVRKPSLPLLYIQQPDSLVVPYIEVIAVIYIKFRHKSSYLIDESVQEAQQETEMSTAEANKLRQERLSIQIGKKEKAKKQQLLLTSEHEK